MVKVSALPLNSTQRIYSLFDSSDATSLHTSMDTSGKLVYTRNIEVPSTNIQIIQEDSVTDGNRIPLSIKEPSPTEVFATSLMHSPNDRFVTVVEDSEDIVYTALA